ncbi:MAG: Cys-Gln thioester bond-forming surface protein, partial [Lachnospiraceae bacterium]|nr:Cys-Gln thioester bond-forming surface protein [Lachnospiraceae bacterium]
MSKKILTIVLSIVMLLGIFPLQAFAASTEAEALGEIDVYSDGTKLNYLSVNGSVREQTYTYYNYVSASGQTKEIPAYCVNPTQYGVPQKVPYGTSIKYLANEKTSDPKVIGIVANGYPTKGLGELGLQSKYEAYYATKMALWCHILSGWSINTMKGNPNLTGADKAAAERVLAAAKKIYSYGTGWTEVLQPEISCSPDKDLAYNVTIDGQQYKQQIFTFHSKTFVANYAVKVAFTDPSSVPAGTKIVDMDNNEISTITVSGSGSNFNGQFKVLYPASAVEGKTGSVQLSFTSTVYSYAIFYAICQEKDKYGNLQNYMVDTDPTTVARLSAISKYASEGTPSTPENPPTEDTPDTGIEISKYETGTNTPLSGARFAVIDPEGATVGIFVTDDAGKITLPVTLCGNYTIVETDPPQYHLLPENNMAQVKVEYGKIAKVSFYNEPYGNLVIEKYSDSGDRLHGAVVKIKHIESGATYSKTTSDVGTAVFEQLKPGAYEIVEVSAPSGYQKDGQTYTANVVSGETVSFTLTNRELPGLRITKYDRKAGTVMTDVTFEIFRDTVSIGTFKTDMLGQIVLKDLQPGTYTAKEVNVDGNHILDTTPQNVELKAGEGIRDLTFFNDVKPGMRLVKIDSQDPSKVIPGAVFEVKSVDGSFGPKEYTTDANGEIDLSALSAGAYVVTEKQCDG